MGILCDPDFDSGRIDNEKVNDIIATVSFIDDAMGVFIENCVLREIYDLSAEFSKQPEIGVSEVTKLPYNKVVHLVVKEMSYCQKLKICKKIAPGLFYGHGEALMKIDQIRNRVAHMWFRGGVMDQTVKEMFTKICDDGVLRDINDEYGDFQKVYNEQRDFILTLEQKFSSEHLGLNQE